MSKKVVVTKEAIIKELVNITDDFFPSEFDEAKRKAFAAHVIAKDDEDPFETFGEFYAYCDGLNQTV